jgi:hypothetical protein
LKKKLTDKEMITYELENNPYDYDFIGISNLTDVRIYMCDFDGYTIAMSVGINSALQDINMNDYMPQAELQIFVTDEVEAYYFYLENPISQAYELFEEIAASLEEKIFVDIEDFQDELETVGIYQYSEQQYDIEQDSYNV